MENCSTKYEIHAPAKLTLSLAIKECGSVSLKIHAIGVGSLESKLQQTVLDQEIKTVLKIQSGGKIRPNPCR